MKFKNAGLLVIAVAMAAFGAVQGSSDYRAVCENGRSMEQAG